MQYGTKNHRSLSTKIQLDIVSMFHKYPRKTFSLIPKFPVSIFAVPAVNRKTVSKSENVNE